MKFFIDTANVDEIREAASLGLLDGVTTNPTLMAREADKGKTFRQILEEICELVDGPISAEAVSLDFEGIVREARELASIHENIVVKIPAIPEGLKAVKALKKLLDEEAATEALKQGCDDRTKVTATIADDVISAAVTKALKEEQA